MSSFESKFKRLGIVTFPTFHNVRVMMMPVVIGDPLPPSLEHYDELVGQMVIHAGQHKGQIGYLTIDEKDITPGQSHRRPGLHVDSVHVVEPEPTFVHPHWEKLPEPPAVPAPDPMMVRLRTLEAENKKLHTANKKLQAALDTARAVGSWGSREHGMLLVASDFGCNLYSGMFEGGTDNEGGCEHLRAQCGTPSPMTPNVIHWLGGLCVHESLPMAKPTRRQLVRLSLPSEGPWFEGYTESPLGVKPTGPILPRRVFMDA